MGRPVKFDEQAILAAALEEGVEVGFERLSASRVAKRLGAPSGSLYHRYPSRNALIARLWLRTVERFQSGYVAIIRGSGAPLARARAAARFVIDWSIEHRAEAELLLRYRREDLLQGDMPAEVTRQAAALNKPAISALRTFASELNPDAPDTERVQFACVSVPVAAVREALVSGTVPSAAARGLVDETVVALLESKE